MQGKGESRRGYSDKGINLIFLSVYRQDFINRERRIVLVEVLKRNVNLKITYKSKCWNKGFERILI